DKELENKIFEIGTYFRYNNRTVEFDYLSRSVKAQMREANRLNSKFVLFVGGEEFSKGEVQLKNMSDGEQQIVHLNNLDSILSIIK
ncbi:MAG: histidine--tRNA ligase, partial [Ignavibacteriae bacterium]|nr:histidine--tRNA ligase [Ignavibacteriota bacterium]